MIYILMACLVPVMIILAASKIWIKAGYLPGYILRGEKNVL